MIYDLSVIFYLLGFWQFSGDAKMNLFIPCWEIQDGHHESCLVYHFLQYILQTLCCLWILLHKINHFGNLAAINLPLKAYISGIQCRLWLGPVWCIKFGVSPDKNTITTDGLLGPLACCWVWGQTCSACVSAFRLNDSICIHKLRTECCHNE